MMTSAPSTDSEIASRSASTGIFGAQCPTTKPLA